MMQSTFIFCQLTRGDCDPLPSELSARSVSQCTKYSATSVAPACNLSVIEPVKTSALRIIKASATCPCERRYTLKMPENVKLMFEHPENQKHRWHYKMKRDFPAQRRSIDVANWPIILLLGHCGPCEPVFWGILCELAAPPEYVARKCSFPKKVIVSSAKNQSCVVPARYSMVLHVGWPKLSFLPVALPETTRVPAERFIVCGGNRGR